MSGNKTVPTELSVDEFIASVPGESKQDDARTLVDLMRRVSGDEPMMWGSAIIGFGWRRLVYDSGREVEVPHIAFSPRKAAISLYLTDDAAAHTDELATIGKHRVGKGCIYVNRLADIDLAKLETFVQRCFDESVESAGAETGTGA